MKRLAAVLSCVAFMISLGGLVGCSADDLVGGELQRRNGTNQVTGNGTNQVTGNGTNQVTGNGTNQVTGNGTNQ